MPYSGVNEDGDAAQGAKLGAAGAPPVDRLLAPVLVFPLGRKGASFVLPWGEKKKSKSRFYFKEKSWLLWVERVTR